MNPKSSTEPEALQREISSFLLANPEEARQLSQETQGMPPKEALAHIALAMDRHNQRLLGIKPRKSIPPGSKPCPRCGQEISANKSLCLGCRDLQSLERNPDPNA